MADNCYGIATDKSGCCVLQHCVEYSKGAQQERLVAEIIANALLLAEDCYGFVSVNSYACRDVVDREAYQLVAEVNIIFLCRHLSMV